MRQECVTGPASPCENLIVHDIDGGEVVDVI